MSVCNFTDSWRYCVNVCNKSPQFKPFFLLRAEADDDVHDALIFFFSHAQPSCSTN